MYNLLYLEKYSYYNPQFTFEFMKLARDEEILHLRALKRDGKINACLLYTSDAADERSSVDLGGRRIIKKKNKATPDPPTEVHNN